MGMRGTFAAKLLFASLFLALSGGCTLMESQFNAKKRPAAAAAEAPLVTAISVTGALPGLTANNNNPAIVGTVSANVTSVEIHTTAGCIGAAVATGTPAAFSTTGIAVAVANDSSTTFYAKGITAADSICSSTSITYVEDSITPPAATGWVMLSPGSGTTSNDSTPILRANDTENGAVIKIYRATAAATCTTVVSTQTVAAGTIMATDISFLTNGTDDGTIHFSYTIEDAAGNTSACTTTGFSYTLDTQLAAVTGWALAPADGAKSNDETPVLTGTHAETAATVKIFSDSGCLTQVGSDTNPSAGTVTVNSITYLTNGTEDGAKAYWYTVSDPAGNSVACTSTTLDYTFDTQAPTGNSILVNSTYMATNSQNVTLTLASTESGSTPHEMCIVDSTASGAADCTGCTYEAYATSKSFSFDTATRERKFVSAKFRDGAGNESACIADSIYFEDVSVNQYYPVGLYWNDHVKASDLTTECDGTEVGTSACLIAGAVRVVETNETSCAGLAVTDSRALMDWTCEIRAGKAVFKGGMKSTRQLYNYLTAGASWTSNMVTLTGCPTCPLTSIARVWWSDTITALPNNSVAGSGLVTLADSNTIYTLTGSRNTDGYLINADKISIAMANTTVMTRNLESTTATTYVLGVNAKKFIWIEGGFIGSTSTNEIEDYAAAGGDHDGTCESGETCYYATSAVENIVDGIGNEDGICEAGEVCTYTKGADYGIYANSAKHMFVRKARVGVNSINGFYLLSSDSNHLAAIVANNNLNFGMNLQGSSHNVISQGSITNNRYEGIYLHASSADNSLSRLTVTGNGDGAGVWYAGVKLEDVSYNTLTSVTVANNNHGLFILNYSSNTSQYNNFHSILATNNNNTFGGDGILFNNASEYATLSQIATSKNGRKGLNLTDATDFKITANLVYGNNSTADCSVSGGSNPGLTGTCGVNGASNHDKVGGKDLSTSVYGKVTGDDTANTSDVAGAQTYTSISLRDHIIFNGQFRGWGMDGSAFPNLDNIGRCLTGTCRIWDMAMRYLDTEILARSNDGSTINAAQYETIGDGYGNDDGVCDPAEICYEIPNGAACPTVVSGSSYLETQTYVYNSNYVAGFNGVEVSGGDSDGVCEAGETCKQVYLKNAIEQNSDLVGDEDGLCESNEYCIYTPNFGSYVGQLGINECTFTDGTVTGVRMFGYTQNGK